MPPEDTDLELSRGEKAESELTQPPRSTLLRSLETLPHAGMLSSDTTPEDIRDSVLSILCAVDTPLTPEEIRQKTRPIASGAARRGTGSGDPSTCSCSLGSGSACRVSDHVRHQGQEQRRCVASRAAGRQRCDPRTFARSLLRKLQVLLTQEAEPRSFRPVLAARVAAPHVALSSGKSVKNACSASLSPGRRDQRAPEWHSLARRASPSASRSCAGRLYSALNERTTGRGCTE